MEWRLTSRSPPKALLVVVVAALGLYLMWIWRPLGLFHSWNEAYYMMRVAHIARGGSYFDWGFDNPPLFVYVLTVLSRLRLNLVFFRLFIVFCTLITTCGVYELGSVFADKKTGMAAAILYAFFPLTVVFSKKLQIDMFGVMLMTLSFYFAVIGVKQKRSWLHLSGVLLGLAVLTKFPFGLVAIPILYYLYRKDVGWKRILFTLSEGALVASLWAGYVVMTRPSFFDERVSSSSNFFGFGAMHAGAPLYQLAMVATAVLTLALLLALFFRRQPANVEERTLGVFSIVYALFFMVLPNHEYYLLPLLVPLFVYVALKWQRGQWRKIAIGFLLVSLLLLACRPVYEVNWRRTTNYIETRYAAENITVYASNPRAAGYYLHRNVTLLTSRVDDGFPPNAVVAFTCYDVANLKAVHLWEPIQEQLVLLKQWDDKMFIYGGEALP